MHDSLARRIADARRRTDDVFDRLTPEGFLERGIAERHRPVFYLGHIDAFDWNLVCRDAAAFAPRHPEWERLFAAGIDPVDGDLPVDQPSDWPSVDEIRAWTRALRADVDQAIADAPLAGWLEGGWAIHLAIEHRLMHAETLHYLLGRLSPEGRRPAPRPLPSMHPAPPNPLVEIPAGRATLGLARARLPHLGWDCEYERHVVDVPSFRIQKHAVTNSEYLEFVWAGGYREPSFWTEDDWAWRLRSGMEHPLPWTHHSGEWRWRTISGDVPLPPSWPAWVSHAEASAFARWKGLALPREVQWHRAALGSPAGVERELPWGQADPVPGMHGNFGFVSDDPAPVDAHPAGASAFGVHELVGNGWQWTRTLFAPFAGFEPLPFYPGYAAGFFDGRHFVLKGAGPRTDASLLRASFRNWFQPHYQHAHAGFRCVED